MRKRLVSFYLNVWFSVDLSNNMHHKSQSRPYWSTGSTGLNINTNLKKLKVLFCALNCFRLLIEHENPPPDPVILQSD